MGGATHSRQDLTEDAFNPPRTLRRSIPTRKDLRQAGRDLRRRTPFQDIARWEPGAQRVDPNDLIAATNAQRLPELVTSRIEKMTKSPFAFFRGSAEVMLADLESLPTSGICHPICGDAHLGNFGPYQLSDARIVFDLNDFDQAGLGPWEWDVGRLCTSVILAHRAAEGSRKDERDIAAQTVRAYRRVLTRAAARSVVERLDGAVFDTRASARTAGLEWRSVRKSLAWKEPNTPGGPASDVDKSGKQQVRFDYSEELEAVKSGPAKKIYTALDAYLVTLPPGRAGLFAKYEAVDVARGQAGIGSLGVRDYRVLLRGGDDADLLELQIKEARPTTQKPSLTLVGADADDHNHAGRSIVLCQRALQAFVDPLLGWTELEERKYYVRKRRATPGSFKPEEVSPDQVAERGELCGAALAYAHARCGNPELVAAYLGNTNDFDRSMADFGAAYADLVERDHARFRDRHA